MVVGKILNRQQAARKLRFDFVAWYKLSIGCEICGYKRHASSLDFDHVIGDKYDDVSSLCGRQAPIEEIILEISKCRILCANHHRVETDKASKGFPTTRDSYLLNASGESLDHWTKRQEQNLSKVREAFTKWRESIHSACRTESPASGEENGRENKESDSNEMDQEKKGSNAERGSNNGSPM